MRGFLKGDFARSCLIVFRPSIRELWDTSGLVMRVEIPSLRSLFAAPMTALFALLTLCVLAVQASPSVGIEIPVLGLRHHGDQISCDGRWEFVQLLDDGRTKINEKEIPERDLPSLVGNIMKSRAERVIYLVPSSGIPYSRLVETLSRLKKTVPDLHVGVMFGKVRDAYMEPRVLSPGHVGRGYLPCDIKWPDGEF
jgi:biopolymer transport protein ExbD